MADPLIKLSGHATGPTGCTAATPEQHPRPGFRPDAPYQNQPHDPLERTARCLSTEKLCQRREHLRWHKQNRTITGEGLAMLSRIEGELRRRGWEAEVRTYTYWYQAEDETRPQIISGTPLDSLAVQVAIDRGVRVHRMTAGGPVLVGRQATVRS